jgi:uncharacterized membrane protein YdbT with pleckstrin-like domain
MPSASAAAAATDPSAEEPVWHGRPSWKHYYGWWMLWLVAAILLGYAASRFEWLNWTLAGIIAGAALIVMLAREAYAIFSMRYRLTTQRLFFDRGILSMKTDQTELVRVDDVSVSKSLTDRIFGTGTVQIVSSDASDKNPKIEGIANPDHVAEQIRRHTRQVRGKQTLFVESI